MVVVIKQPTSWVEAEEELKVLACDCGLQMMDDERAGGLD